jgi:transcriptional regulator NrdR family protein
MSAHERKLRSAINKLLSQQGVIHGTLIARRRVCGKCNCRCAKGRLHESLYLVVTEAGKGRQMYVPRQWGSAVRQWIEQYAQSRRLMDELSSLHWQKIRQRQD